MKAYTHTHTHTHIYIVKVYIYTLPYSKKGNNRILESQCNILLKYIPVCYCLENKVIKAGRTAILHRVLRCVCVFT